MVRSVRKAMTWPWRTRPGEWLRSPQRDRHRPSSFSPPNPAPPSCPPFTPAAPGLLFLQQVKQARWRGLHTCRLLDVVCLEVSAPPPLLSGPCFMPPNPRLSVTFLFTAARVNVHACARPHTHTHAHHFSSTYPTVFFSAAHVTT